MARRDVLSQWDHEVPDGLPIGGRWVSTQAADSVVDAWTQDQLTEVPRGSEELASAALQHGDQLRHGFRRTTAGARKQLVQQCAARLAARREQLEDLLILETGKPRRDCRTEVARTLSCWEASAEEVGRDQGELVPVDLQPGGEDMLAWYRRRPRGTVVAIAGFNYPLLLASHKVAPALAVGAPVVLKPAPATPLSALWLAALIREALIEADLPPGLIQCMTGGPDVGDALVRDDRAAVVSFTGSATVGHTIARTAAPRRTVLELGSNAALVVTGSAEIDDVVRAVTRGGFYANGQACIAVQRLIILDDVDEAFEERLREAVEQVVVGDPWDERTEVAALITGRSGAHVTSTVDGALQRGAQVLAQASVPAELRPGAQEALIAPQVLTDVDAGDTLWREEIFAPVVCLRRVADIHEAIRLVNDSRYGLQAAIYTGDLAEAHLAIDELEVGGVVVNQVPGFRSDVMPYGGVRDSGIGREGPRWAAQEYTDTRMALIRVPEVGTAAVGKDA